MCRPPSTGLETRRYRSGAGLDSGWVSRTLTKYRQHGQDALTWRKPAGAAAKLTDNQLAQRVEELDKGPQYHGFPGHVWTRPRVNEPGCRSSHQTALRGQL